MALAEALLPLRHKAVNGYFVKFPELHCEPVPHVLLDIVIQGQSFAPKSFFEFLQECRDCVGRMRPCIVMEPNDPMGELAWSFRFDRLAKGGQGCE